VRPQALGELPTTATPTPPGLAIDPELTLPYDRGRTSATANPVATSPSGSLERTTGTTVVLGRMHLAAIAALVVVLAAGVAVLGFAALRRSSLGSQLPMLGTLPQASDSSDVAADGSAPPPQQEAPSSETPTTPPAVQSAANRDVAATAGAGAAIPAGGASTSADSRTAPPPSSAVRSEPHAADSAAAKIAPATPPPATAAPVVFDDVRVLVTDEGNKGRERDAVLQFGDARISVLERADGPSIASIPYKTVLGAFYSRSKQPKWKDADGKEVESKVDLGRLGFLRGERNWLILLTKSEPVIIRIEDSDLKTVLPAFTEQTGIAIQR
jgi:hypothetical protein